MQLQGYFTTVPFGMGQNLLKVTRFGFRHYLGHAVHIFSGPCLHQTAGILSCFIRNVVTVRFEVFRIAIHEKYEAPTDAGKRRVRGCIKFTPFFSKMFSLALTS